MTITLRIDKGSALSHEELDGNFTDLDGRINTINGSISTLQTDVAAIPNLGDSSADLNVNSVTTNFVSTSGINSTTDITTPLANLTTVNATNIDVSKIIINSSSTEDRPILAVSNGDGIDKVSKFIRAASSVGTTAKSAIVSHTEYSVAGAAGMGTGIWNTINATDMTNPISLAGMQAEAKAYTDENNYTSEFSVYSLDRTAGTGNFQKRLSVASDEVRILNVGGKVVIENLPTSDPTSAGQLWNDNGTLKVSAG